MKQKLLCVGVLLSLASAADAQVLGLPDQLVARNLFAQVSPTAPPTAPLPGGLTLDQYAYITSQQAYLIGLLGRIEQDLEGMRALKQASDTVYMQRIGELETKLGRLIEDRSTSTGTKLTATLGAVAAAAFSAYSATANPRCQP